MKPRTVVLWATLACNGPLLLACGQDKGTTGGGTSNAGSSAGGASSGGSSAGTASGTAGAGSTSGTIGGSGGTSGGQGSSGNTGATGRSTGGGTSSGRSSSSVGNTSGTGTGGATGGSSASASSSSAGSTGNATSGTSGGSSGSSSSGTSGGGCVTQTLSTASALQATSTCLTAGTSAALAAVVTLVDTTGQPITGATVTFDVSGLTPSWVEAQTVEVPVPAGTYYRTLVAPAAPGTGTLSAQVTWCSQTTSLTQTLPLTFASPAPATGFAGSPFQGVAGCSPVQGSLRVLAVEAETGAPIAGASVLVGSAGATPYVGSAAALWPSPTASAPNTATTDAQGYATFQDFGTALSGAQIVTAGAAGRAYATAYDFNGADVVLALPQTRPTLTADALAAGTASGFTPKSKCDGDVQVGVAFASEPLARFGAFTFGGLFGPYTCTATGSDDAPDNMYFPSECAACFIGVCLSTIQNDWTLTAPTGSELGMPFVLTPTTNLQNGDNVAAIQQATWQGIGYQAVAGSGATSGDNLAVGADTYPFQTTFNYSGQPDPTHTDVIGLAALDYSGGDGTGPIGVNGVNVNSSFGVGGSVAVSVGTATTAPAGSRYLGSVEVEYITPPSGFTPPADVLFGTSSVLVRQAAGGGAPFDASAAHAVSVSGFLNLVPIAIAPGDTTFTFADGALAGQTSDYSLSTLEIAHTTWFAQQSCQKAPPTQVTATYPEWLVYKPYALDGAGCSALDPATAGCEGFTLPTLPSAFPRAAAATQQQSGFEGYVGSGKACSAAAPCALANESCAVPTGSGLPAQCMGSAGGLYFTESYRWTFTESHLGLTPGAITAGAADFTQALPGTTELSANSAVFP